MRFIRAKVTLREVFLDVYPPPSRHTSPYVHYFLHSTILSGQANVKRLAIYDSTFVVGLCRIIDVISCKIPGKVWCSTRTVTTVCRAAKAVVGDVDIRHRGIALLPGGFPTVPGKEIARGIDITYTVTPRVLDEE
jgi:hypothetical protein